MAYGLQTDDVLETALRQLGAAAKEFRATRDAAAADNMLAINTGETTLAPRWLREEARTASHAQYKQEVRTRGPRDKKGKGKGKDKEPVQK